MNETHAIARSLSALGHEARLGIFRLLVEAGHDGLTVGQIAGHSGLAASTLAHHLRSLVDAGLVAQEKQGREVVNRVRFEQMDSVIAFLTRNCCAGLAVNPNP